MWFRTRQLVNLETQLAELRGKVETRTPATLAARIDELEAAFENYRTTIKREMGRLHARLRRDDASPDTPESETGDPKLDAILRAQRGETVENLPPRHQ